MKDLKTSTRLNLGLFLVAWAQDRAVILFEAAGAFKIKHTSSPPLPLR